LPVLSLQLPQTTIGSSTAEAIHCGVVNGIVHEINGHIASFQKNNANFIIILTGGDTIFLANQLKNTIFANSNFLLESLNQTFQYNQK
jgi:type III pantothenate kinase